LTHINVLSGKRLLLAPQRKFDDSMSDEPVLNLRRRLGGRLEFSAIGAWTAAHVESLERQVNAAESEFDKALITLIDLNGVRELDTLGAWLLERLVRRAGEAGREARFVEVPAHYRGLLDEVHQVNRQTPAAVPKANPVLTALEAVGRASLTVRTSLVIFLDMLGALGAALLRVLLRPQTFRFTSAVHHVFRVGWQAVPIIVLITFLIGCIISQQGFFHFRKFGADAYVVDMIGILVLRELGVLIVAIMVAGRSGSSYTAELGSMKMREEIDALRTMGFDPVEVLILPRVIALVIALPILTFIGSMAALYGGGLVAWFYGDMNPSIFIARLREAISVTHFQVGMIKSPFMALVIGIVACSEGLQVKGSAESLGLQTTTSVVKSIFLVIVLDGVFAIFFASIGM
jgi:phospholipid/cholesterol/gamma-HCH transport system permease protein